MYDMCPNEIDLPASDADRLSDKETDLTHESHILVQIRKDLYEPDVSICHVVCHGSCLAACHWHV